MYRKTKTICTLGPTSESEEKIRELINIGMDVARLNFSHGTYEEHLIKIDRIKKVRQELNKPVAIVLDTKGPEIRLGEFEGQIGLEKGQKFVFVDENIIGNNEKGCLNYKNLYKFVKPGNRILLNDGLVEMEVENVEGTSINCTVKNSGYIASKKNMHICGVDLKFPAFTEKDKSDILFGIQNGVDFIAASFVQSANDILQIRKLLDENKGRSIKIIAKIENKKGVQNIDEIINVVDGVMVARGDLGLDIPFEEVPRVQKEIIRNCLKNGKIVIIATQMLESMINNPRPTRAEASDVANAIYDGATAVMLSGETANGKYPVECLSTMINIITKTEESIDFAKRYKNRRYMPKTDVVNAIAQSTCTTATELNVTAIISITKSGHTARLVSNYHPKTTILGVTKSDKTARQLNILWGVIPVVNKEENNNTDDLFKNSIEICKQQGLINKNDVVILTAGIPSGFASHTNIMKVEVI